MQLIPAAPDLTHSSGRPKPLTAQVCHLLMHPPIYLLWITFSQSKVLCSATCMVWPPTKSHPKCAICRS